MAMAKGKWEMADDEGRSMGDAWSVRPMEVQAHRRPSTVTKPNHGAREPFRASFQILLLAGLSATAISSPAQERQGTKKQLVAHRGASAYAPEHTLEAYRLAIEQGVDFVEQDLAVTKDGILVCIHDLTLERTTNVEELFPDRFVEDKSGPAPSRRWLVGDFTLAEIKRLDAGSWFDAKFAAARVPTFQEAIDVVRGKAGLYPELKDPAFYRKRAVAPENLLAEILEKNRLVADAKTPVIIQSFDENTIKLLAKRLPQIRRVWLVEARDAQRLGSRRSLEEIATWATGVGPNKSIIGARPEIVTWAHAAGLTVTPWTFRSSDTGAFASVREEMTKFLYEYGVDAVFTDNPDQFPRR
jgi:glycerophosphoryl diester phosphodiesterase